MLIFVIDMNIKTDIPQIYVLRKRIEQKIGFTPTMHIHFLKLVSIIEGELREHVSESTLERVWGYSTRGYESVSLRTLNVLSQLIGCRDWDEFCTMLRNELMFESDLFHVDTILTSQLKINTRLRIGWMPDRICEIRYLGNNRFVIEKVVNSSTLIPGDSFSCLNFQKGRALYMDLFCKANEEHCERVHYAVGLRNGITSLEIL